jgi:tetratricopeptide (TPR) repeat protein
VNGNDGWPDNCNRNCNHWHLNAGGLAVFLFLLIRGLRTQIFSLKETLDIQKGTLDIMERRIAETEKVGVIYKRFFRNLPEELEVVLGLKEETISELQRENKRLLERELNLQSEPIQLFVQQQIPDNLKDPGLARAHNALASGDVDQALRTLTELSQRNREYDKQLLSALVMSKKPEDWEHAERLLPEFGTPDHYNRLSVAFWTSNDVTKAIALAERGLTLERKGRSEDPIVIAKIKNSLAYYYADAVREDKADDARELVEEAIKISESEKNHTQYAKCLDTRGYVKIVFGTSNEEVLDGVKDCEDAR